MQVKFLDSDNIIDLTINFTKNKQVDFLKDLQTNILNSLNYASNQK